MWQQMAVEPVAVFPCRWMAVTWLLQRPRQHVAANDARKRRRTGTCNVDRRVYSKISGKKWLTRLWYFVPYKYSLQTRAAPLAWSSNLDLLQVNVWGVRQALRSIQDGTVRLQYHRHGRCRRCRRYCRYFTRLYGFGHSRKGAPISIKMNISRGRYLASNLYSITVPSHLKCTVQYCTQSSHVASCTSTSSSLQNLHDPSTSEK